MRTIHTLPLAAAILLAACGGGADADGDGEISGEEAVAEAGGLPQPEPGQYRTSFELLEFDAPGMSDAAKQQMQQIFSGSLAEGTLFCLTPEDAAQNGQEEMLKNLGDGDCTVQSFDVSGGTVAAEMQCPGQSGTGTSTMKLAGTMRSDGSDMTMETSQEMSNVGATRMKMRVVSERVGDCPA